MPFTVTMPKLSPTMEAGTIAKWHKKEGDLVQAGDVLLEVSTDKATVEHSALDAGYLRKILVVEGSDASVNQPIAVFTEDPKESIENYKPEGVVEKAPVVSAPQAAPVKAQAQAAPVKATQAARAERIIASPLARKLAQERGIELSQIAGSGPRGRIIAKDLEKKAAVKALPLGKPGEYEEIPLNQVRKVISQRLQEAKSTIPHFYVTLDIDAEPLMQFRTQLEKTGLKVSFNDCIVKACSLALREHPVVNSGFNAAAQTILRFKSIDISVAVSVEDGLITPIIFQADQKSLAEISQEIRALAKKAKEGKLAPQEFQGGSFTVSNLGMFGVSHFQAILNPPQAAILAVGAIQEQPVVRDGKVIPGHVLHLTISSDHRVVDGVAAAQFLKTLQKFLENPVALLL
jgi:pyruvate dehydrogenase E2 component (dihydrolipoamide acetyltransferase)